MRFDGFKIWASGPVVVSLNSLCEIHKIRKLAIEVVNDMTLNSLCEILEGYSS